MTSTKYSVTDNAVAQLAAGLANPNSFRGAADDLLRGLGLGPAGLAQLTLAPKSERRAALAAMLKLPVDETQPPLAEATEATSPATAPAVVPAVAPRVDNLPAWRLAHLRRHGRA